MNNLLHFLTGLAVEPKQQEMFAKSPTALIEAAGLSEASRAKLSTGDRAGVTTLFAEQLETHELVAVMGSAVLTEPGPDPIPDPDPEPIPDPPAMVAIDDEQV